MAKGVFTSVGTCRLAKDLSEDFSGKSGQPSICCPRLYCTQIKGGSHRWQPLPTIHAIVAGMRDGLLLITDKNVII